MPEHLPKSPLSPEEYQQFVASSQFDLGEEWKPQYAAWIRSETIEFLAQHGPGALLVMPERFDIDTERVHDQYPELREQMLDELSDLVWFGFSVAERTGIKAIDACRYSLSQNGVRLEESAHDFSTLSEAVCQNADKIRVPNKITALFPEASESLKTTGLNENPFYVLQRTAARLSRILDDEQTGTLPTMTDLEEPTEITHAIGDYLNTMAYIAAVQLDSDIQTVAEINTAKLKQRQIHGKQ